MNKLTPSEALQKMINFKDRVKRIEANEYTDKRFLTADQNAMRGEFRYMVLWHSIAIFNKNQNRFKEEMKDIEVAYMRSTNWL
jgi:hypothetical protein